MTWQVVAGLIVAAGVVLVVVVKMIEAVCPKWDGEPPQPWPKPPSKPEE